jgi:hypothetical protein
MSRSKSSFTKKSCACALVAFPAEIIS